MNQDLSNYRIRKETKNNITTYYPQCKWLWFWVDMFQYEGTKSRFNKYMESQGFASYDDAKCAILSQLPPDVEYLEVNLND